MCENIFTFALIVFYKLLSLKHKALPEISVADALTFDWALKHVLVCLCFIKFLISQVDVFCVLPI